MSNLRRLAYQAWTALTGRDRSWQDLLAQVGLRVDVTNEEKFAASLAGKIHVDRSVPGFEDFAAEGIRGIEPGCPARSLLYHALASPFVTHYKEHKLGVYPKLCQIDAIENYVYGVRPPTLAKLRASAGGAPLAIAVFAYDYRPAIQTVHRRHADLCLSRTGVARVGNKKAGYVDHARGFLPSLEGDDPCDIRVIPCRYAAFIAARLHGDEARFGPMRFRKSAGTPTAGVPDVSDDQRWFWVPLHKLFDGDECISGQTGLQVDFEMFHVNEKLQRVHIALRDPSAKALDYPPFRFSEEIAGKAPLGLSGAAATPPGCQTAGSILVMPYPHTLVQAAKLKGRLSNFRLPEFPKVLGTSLHLEPPDGTDNRAWSEFVNCSTKITPGQARDLSKHPNYVAQVEGGGFDALHLRDFTGDGFVRAKCAQLKKQLPLSVPAYSIAAPPDFFPLVTQKDLADWFDSLPPNLQNLIWTSAGVNPEPLSDARLPANLKIKKAGFAQDDNTISAIVSPLGSAGAAAVRPFHGDVVRASSLPDHAAGLFAPGWDTSQDLIQARNSHLAAYGLGSPFPEDMKLCAALSAFWPAATPDTTRFYPQRSTYPSTTPLPDSYAGWDQVPLPQPEKPNARVYLYKSLAAANYVRTALANGFQLGRMAGVNFKQYTEWTLVMARVHLALGAQTPQDAAVWHLPSFKPAKANDPDLLQAVRQSGATMLSGQVYRLLLFKGRLLTSKPRDPTMVRVAVDEIRLVFADTNTVLMQDNAKKWSKA